jgi:hypothetical protein
MEAHGGRGGIAVSINEECYVRDNQLALGNNNSYETSIP